jgi:flavin reductase (DIM6/NTAB) family NADH-FMN oxidoreductase RutF
MNGDLRLRTGVNCDVYSFFFSLASALSLHRVSSADYSFAALRATRECVIAVPALELALKVVKVGNCSGRDVEKFAKFGLTCRTSSVLSHQRHS